MPRKPSPAGKKGDEKKVALVFTAEQTKYRNGINVTAAHSSSNAYNSQSTIRCVTGFSTAIPSLLPTQHPKNKIATPPPPPNRSTSKKTPQPPIRGVRGFPTAIPSLLPTQHPLDDGESHEDERKRPADATGVPQIPDLKPILIKIHHDR